MISTPFTHARSHQRGLNGAVVFEATTSTTVPYSNRTIFVMQPNSEGPHELTLGMQPCLSPSGDWVAFTRQTDTPYSRAAQFRRQLWRINIDGTGEKQLTFPIYPDYPDANAASISPDELMIAFFGGLEEDRIDPQKQSIFTYGYRNVWLMPVGGSYRRRLTNCKPVRTQEELDEATECIVADNPKWTPDGKTITFETVWPPRIRGNEIWAVNPDGTNFRRYGPIIKAPL